MKKQSLVPVLIILNSITIALVLGMVVFLSRHSAHPFKASHEQLVQKVEASSNVQALKAMIIEDDSYIRVLERIVNGYYSESCVFLVIVSFFPIVSLFILFFGKKNLRPPPTQSS